MKLSTLPLFVLCLGLMACSESAQDLLDTKGPEAQTKFGQFYQCYELALSAPPIHKDKINWETNDANCEYGESNVYQIGIESFKDLSQPLDVPFDGTRRREHADMAQLFKIDLTAHQQAHEFPVDDAYSYHKVESGNSCKNAILNFLNTKYLLINRISLQARPYQVDSETFMKGLVAGDVLVFDVTQAKLLGGFLIEAESKDYMQIGEFDDLGANLDADLGMRAYRSTIEKFVALTPSVEKADFEF